MRVLACLLLLMLALAGCTDDAAPSSDGAETDADPEPGPADGSGTSSGDDDVEPEDDDAGNEPGEGSGPAANEAPTASIEADKVSGLAPLEVTFTVDGADADGSIASWSLGLGDEVIGEGESMPANVSYTFSNPGEYEVFVTALDDDGDAGVASVVVNVTSLDPFDAAVDLDLPCEGCPHRGTSACLWRQHGNDDAQDCAWVDLPPDAAGRAFTVTSSAGHGHILFWGGCGDEVLDKHEGEGDKSGTVPEGATCALLWYWGAAPETAATVSLHID